MATMVFISMKIGEMAKGSTYAMLWEVAFAVSKEHELLLVSRSATVSPKQTAVFDHTL